MVFTCPLISKSSSALNKIPDYCRLTRKLVSPSSSWTLIFSSLARFSYVSLFSLSFNFTLWSAGAATSTIRQVFCFFFNFVQLHLVWSSGRDSVICLHLKIQEEYVRIILQNVFWVVNIPLVSMVRFQFLAQFPIDHLTHAVVTRYILSLGLLAAFTYYMIDCFVSIIT